jgi:NAD(P)-dependent dehydrogenase (short-subunit alcohol dehydrogenase family)
MKNDSYLETMFGLTGRVAVVIGGTGELCGAMADGLSAAGAEVVLVGRNPEKARARLERIAAAGGRGWFHAAEATNKQDLEKLRDAVVKRSGRIDIVINGAGTNSPTPFFDITEEEFERIVRVNVNSVFLGCQVFGRYLVERGQGGSVINIGSMSGLTPLSRVFTYSATKAAVHNLSKNLARDWAPHRVRVNTLVPGFFPAEQNRKVLTPERVASIMGHTPMGRFGSPNELVGAVLLLASERAGSFITGTELVVDGGFNAMSL